MKYSENVGELFFTAYNGRPQLDCLSDVILYWDLSKGRIYHNCMTGRRSYNLYEVIRYETRNLFFKKTSKPILGYHVGYSEKSDSIIIEFLLLRTAYLNEGVVTGWESRGNGYEIRRDGNAYSSCAWEKGTTINNMVDACAETMWRVEMRNKECYVHRHTAEVMRNFFGTEWFTSSNMGICSFSNDYHLNLFCQETMPTVPTKKQEQLDELLAINLPEIKMNDDILSIVNTVLAYNPYYEHTTEELEKAQFRFFFCYIKSIPKFCIVQKAAEDIAVIRYFTPQADTKKVLYMENLKTDDWSIAETTRVYITKNEILNCRLFGGKFIYVKKSSKQNNYSALMLPWNAEDLAGTKLQYFKRVADDSKKIIKEILKDKSNYCAGLNITTNFHSMLEVPLAESFYSSGLNGFMEFLNTVSDDVSPKKMLEYIFGEIDTKQKQLFKAIGLSATNVRWLNEEVAKKLETEKATNGTRYWETRINVEKYACRISILKKMFSSCPEYLENMNLEQFKDIVMFHIDSCNWQNGSFGEIIEKMVSLWGPKNAKNYFLEIQKASDFGNCEGNYYRRGLHFYNDYINMAFEMKQYGVRVQQWKFKDLEELMKIHNDIAGVYNSLRTQAEMELYKKQQETLSKKWNKLLYKEDKFQILAPTCAEDIANEGFYLHHCVKSYIMAVYEGKTIILFIRKSDEINVPYYTLEIRGRVIRQCHGFSNCNPTPELVAFLKRYCDDKNLHIGDIERVLPV